MKWVIPLTDSYDAVIIGSGPNGLTAAIELALAKIKVGVFEADEQPGGGARTSALTLPGFCHDICSAVHPMGIGSPAFRRYPLGDYKLEWIHPPAPLAHPFEDGSAVLVRRSVDETASELGADAGAYRSLMNPLVEHWESLAQEFLQPMIHIPQHPLRLGKFGLQGIHSAEAFACTHFQGVAARGVFAGNAAHSILPLEKSGSAAFGLILNMLAHAVGWPIPRGGSQSLTNALIEYLRSLGGEVITGRRVENVDEFPNSRAILCDLTPRPLLAIAGHRFTESYRRKLEKYRYGPGVFKVDWALREPIPWRAPECKQAASVHLGATLEEIAASERAPWQGHSVDKPFVILAQPSLFDNTRAPAHRHTAWAYCHVTNGSRESMIDQIESQVERFAPGFRQMIMARHTFNAAALEQHNPNYVGGDIIGGAQNLRQLFFRPTRRLYRTSAKNIYICSSATPPGGGVHGMCGYHAAHTVLKDLGA